MAESALRASDADRERVGQRLRQAQDEGRISLLEFDERLAAAYAARTYAELEPLTADLPSSGPPGRPDVPRRRPGRSLGVMPPVGFARTRRRNGWQVARRVQFAALVLAGLINFVIWVAVSLGTASIVYPWWIWVVGPWGLVLVAETVVARVLAAPNSTT